jgi:lipid II:glycine glycyltransferase (peptidoglycan interpeptide bridge formation enzyme)
MRALSQIAYTEHFRTSIERIDDAQALGFWKSSSQSTPFTNPKILSRLCAEVHWWQASVNGLSMCLWPVCKRLDGVWDAPQFSYYVGPIWSRGANDGSLRGQLLRRTAVIDELCSTLLTQYGGFAIELPPSELDIRPYRWWARSLDVEIALSITPQYSAVIDLRKFSDENSILDNFSRERRSSVARHLRNGLPQNAEWTTETCLDLYKQMAERQRHPDLFESRRGELEALCELVHEGSGRVLAYRAPDGDHVVAMQLVIAAGDTACVVLSLADHESRERNIAAWMTYVALLESRSQGISTHDFNGANSLVRGSDVQSYGANAALYFSVECRPNLASTSSHL